jgi:hypothetical protein
MFLFEFDSPDPFIVKLIAVTNQLKSDMDSGLEKTNWTTNEFLDYLQANGINLDTTDLYNMIKKPPLKNVISNIQGDAVIFKGHEPTPVTPAMPDQENSQKIVAQMAQSAMK